MWFRKAGWVCATVAWLAGAYGPALAQEPGAECEAATTNLEMRNCRTSAYQDADKQLNAVWKKVLAVVDDADYLTAEQRVAWKKELREAQRAWVQFKEHDCNGAVLYEWWGGSGAGAAISGCILGHTVTRTMDLRQRYLDR